MVVQLPSDEAQVQTCFPGSPVLGHQALPSSSYLPCFDSESTEDEAIWPWWLLLERMIIWLLTTYMVPAGGSAMGLPGPGCNVSTSPPPATRCPDEPELY